jgi:hypothetical protein
MRWTEPVLQGATPRRRHQTVGAGLRPVAHRIRRSRRQRRPAEGRGLHQRRHRRVAERAARVLAGPDHSRDHRPVGFLRQGRPRRPAKGRARGRQTPPGRIGQRHAHPGPPTSHPRKLWSACSQDRPGPGGPSPAVDRERALAARILCEDVDLSERHRRRGACKSLRPTRSKRNSGRCFRWPGPIPNATSTFVRLTANCEWITEHVWRARYMAEPDMFASIGSPRNRQRLRSTLKVVNLWHRTKFASV